MENTTDTEKNDVSNTETVAKTDEITTGNIDENTTDNGNNPDVPEPPKSSKLNSLIHNDGTYSSSVVEYDDTKNFRFKKYQDEKAPKTRTIKIFDVEHTLTYKETEMTEYSGVCVDYYKVSDIEGGIICFISNSDQMIKCYNIPIPRELKIEQEYKDFIRSLVPAEIDYSAYDYAVETFYNGKFSEDKFIEKDENTDVRYCALIYSERYKNVETGNYVFFVSRSDNTFQLEIIMANYDMEVLHKTIDEFLEASDEFQRDIFAKIKEPCVPQEITKQYHSFFMRDGKAYILSNIYIDVSSIDEDGISFITTENFYVITSLKSDEDTSEN